MKWGGNLKGLSHEGGYNKSGESLDAAPLKKGPTD